MCDEHVQQPTICHDCDAKEGEFHQFGCDMERCPFCGGQLVSCGCMYIKLGYDYQPKTYNHDTGQMEGHPTNGLPKDVYQKGVSDEEWQRYQEMVETEGRAPYIVWPNLCARCGELWPDIFMVPDKVWDRYVLLAEREKMLCLKCLREIVTLVDADPVVLQILSEIEAATEHSGRLRNDG